MSIRCGGYCHLPPLFYCLFEAVLHEHFVIAFIYISLLFNSIDLFGGKRRRRCESCVFRTLYTQPGHFTWRLHIIFNVFKSVAVNLRFFSVDAIYSRHGCVQCTHTRTQYSMASTEEIKNWKSWEKKIVYFSVVKPQMCTTWTLWCLTMLDTQRFLDSFGLSQFLHEKEKYISNKTNRICNVMH